MRSFTPEKNSAPSTMSTRIIAVPRSSPGQDGRDHEAPTGHERDEHVPPQAQQRLLAEQHVAHPQREAELEELRGLELEARDHDPVAVSVRLDAEPGTNTSSWNSTAPISAGHAARFQNAIGRRLAMNISGMPITANTACLMTAS